MGTSLTEGDGDYLMPRSRVLNWNRLPLALALILPPSHRRFAIFNSRLMMRACVTSERVGANDEQKRSRTVLAGHRNDS